MNYKTVEKEISFETLNQGSKFIGYISPVSNIEDVKNFLSRLKKQHPFATHICFAFSFYENNFKNVRYKFSDDGEPAGTAGKPLLEVLKNNDFCNVCFCVVRYFGGTLLGASNLLRAYVNGMTKTIEKAKIIEKHFVEVFDVFVSYNELDKVEKFLIENQIKTLDTDFAEDVKISVGINVDNTQKVLSTINDLLSRKVEIQRIDKRFI